MRTRYDKQRLSRKQVESARRRFRRRDQLAHRVQQALQLSFDRQEILDLLQDSLDTFAIEIGRRVAVGLLVDEVEELCGPKHQWGQQGRTATRHGSQPCYVCVGGQKLAIQRPRVRSTQGGGEVPLSRYGDLQRLDALPQGFLRRMVRGASPPLAR